MKKIAIFLVVISILLSSVNADAVAAGNSAEIMYEEGMDFFEKGDYDRAFARFQLAGDVKGYALAQNMLGVCYRDGFGTAPDIIEAEKYFRLSAEQGYAPAQENLSALHVEDNSSSTSHTHQWQDATCTEPVTCTICGQTKGNSLGHMYVSDKAVEATCTEEGLTEGIHCSVCGEVLVPQKSVAPLGHSWIAATEETPKTCSRCGLIEGEPLNNSTPYIGATLAPLPEEIIKGTGISSGALIYAVREGTPAFNAGMKANDIVTHVDNRRIASAGDLAQLISDSNPGKVLQFLIYRQGKLLDINVTVELKPDSSASSSAFAVSSDNSTPYIGVTLAPLSDEMAKSSDISSGALIYAVKDGAPASKAGLKENDIVVAADGKLITRAEDLAQLISDSNPGKVLQFLIYRQGKLLDINVTVESKPDSSASSSAFAVSSDNSTPYIGVTLAPLSDEMAKSSDISSGALIYAVKDGAPASKAGLKENDIVTHVDDKKITSAGDLAVLIAESRPGNILHFRIYRQSNIMYIDVKVEAKLD